MSHRRLVLYTDGGSRLRGKRFAAAAAILHDGERIIQESARILGELTNNQAEYSALIMGIEMALNVGGEGVEELICISDSQLMIRQLNGEYKVKNVSLKPLAEMVKELAQGFNLVLYVHTNRDHPMVQRADMLVNRILDEEWSKR